MQGVAEKDLHTMAEWGVQSFGLTGVWRDDVRFRVKSLESSTATVLGLVTCHCDEANHTADRRVWSFVVFLVSSNVLSASSQTSRQRLD